MMQLSPRQIHLDFHTSEYIPGIGSQFDAAEFARMAKDASISSMTVFARGHHGWLYYNSRRFPELMHPHLEKKNLLLEQVDALHEQGINAPIYITVQWDYHSATTRPEWLIRKQDGSHEGQSFTEPGFYQSLCVNTGYRDFLKEMTAEICDELRGKLDGVFFDIVGIRPCWCASCRADMKKAGINMKDEAEVRRFAKQTIDGFKADMTQLVRQYSDDCTIFYNAGHVGPCTWDSRETYTHFELESLPSGAWGYLHFPLTARYARKLGMDCLGMTGKFHTEWGDFHSLKNLAALEFECFRMLSFGFASSIGDQLEPNGQLNPATYKLIGQVYSQFAAREAWARPSQPLVEAAVLTPENTMYEHQIPDSLMGAVQMLEELSLQFDIIDDSMDFSAYKLLILPDDLLVSQETQKKIDQYADAGGRVIACMQGGLSEAGVYPDSFAASYEGLNPDYPDFIVAQGALAGELEPGQSYAIYMQGAKVSAQGAETLIEAQAPYFPRQGDHFCSHRYTPSAHGETYPVAFKNGQVILFSHPLFSQYRYNAPNWCKKLVAAAIDTLLPSRLVTHDGPSTVTASLLDQPQEKRVNLHLLSYVPVRKSAMIDIIEERTKVNHVELSLQLPYEIKKARLVPENISLQYQDGRLIVPEIDGYAIVELTY